MAGLLYSIRIRHVLSVVSLKVKKISSDRQANYFAPGFSSLQLIMKRWSKRSETGNRLDSEIDSHRTGDSEESNR